MAKMGYAQRIRVRMAELQKVISDAQAELSELEVAERVLERLASDQDEDADVGARKARSAREPTIADMAVKFLGDVGPMTTAELLDHMRENWREDLGDTTLTSTLSRTKNAGRIEYGDGRWRVADGSPKENEPPEGGSEAGEGDASPDTRDEDPFAIFAQTPARRPADPALHSGREGGD